jgi:hypothetical protein
MDNSAIELASEVQDERQHALNIYRDLLTAGPLTDEQREALRDAIRKLQRTPDQVRDDLAVLSRIADLKQKIAHARSDEVVRREAETRIACKEFAEETRMLIEERNREYAKLVAASNAVQRLIVDAENRICHELLRLEHDHFELLGIRQPHILRSDDGHHQTA